MIPFFSLVIAIVFLHLFTNSIVLRKHKYSHSISSFSVERENRFFLVLSCLLFIFFAGLKSKNTGWDVQSYLEAFNYFHKCTFRDIIQGNVGYYNFEVGFSFLLKLLSCISTSYTFLFFSMAVIIYVPIFFLIYRFSCYSWLSLVVFVSYAYFIHSFCIYRQAIAASLCCIAFVMLQKKHILSFYVFVFFAFLFHRSSLIFTIVYPLTVLLENRKYYTLISISIFVIELINVFFGEYLLNIVFMFFSSYTGYIGGRYGGESGGYLNLLFINVIYIWMLLGIKLKKNKNRFDCSLVAVLFLAILISSEAYNFNIISRAVWYFVIYTTIAIPYLIHDTVAKRSRIKIQILFFIFFVFYLYYSLSGMNSEIVPYKFLWS